MERKRILVVEDQKDSIGLAFEIMNKLYFGGTLEIEFVPRSQDIAYDRLEEYAMIFVDITLADKSEKNGFGIIRHILDNNLYPEEKILILTGNSRVNDGIIENNIPDAIKVVYKPASFSDLAADVRHRL